jgi:hypothetical protein
VGIGGCDSGTSDGAEPEAIQEMKSFGVQSSNSFEFAFTNRTRHQLVGIAIKNALADEFTVITFGNDARVDHRETVKVHYSPEAVENVAETTIEEMADFAINTLYDVNFLAGDGTEMTVHGFDLSNISEFAVHFEDGVTYVEYLDTASGAMVDTKDAELLYRETKVQEADEAARKKAEMEAAAIETTTPSNNGTDYWVPDAQWTAPISQTQDNCLADESPVINF